MAAPTENMVEIPLPPVPDVISKMPWIKLGNFEIASSKTPPPKPYPAQSKPAERAAARFGVHGNAVLTGGAGMLALTSARALLEHGLTGLALFDLPSALEKGQNAIEALRAEFSSAKIIKQACDVTDEKGMIAAIQSAKAQLGELNILCCFAGMVGCVPSAEQSVDHWRKIIDVNTTGCWIAAQAVGREMITSKHGGKIIFIASISGHRVNYPQPQAAYNTSKAALLHMKNSLAAEWTRYGIHVNTISPGYMDTVLNEGNDLAPWRQIWAERNPMRRMGSPEELTGPVILLCSDIGGSYINGVDIVVDGGEEGLLAMASDRALNIAELSVSHRDDHLGWGASISVINESVEYIQDKSIKEAIQDVAPVPALSGYCRHLLTRDRQLNPSYNLQATELSFTPRLSSGILGLFSVLVAFTNCVTFESDYTRVNPAIGLVTLVSAVAAQGITAIHEPGRCAIRGHCGKKSIFGGELPCPDNGLAREPDDAVREKLVSLCGSKWSEGPVCCEDEQVDALKKNLKLAEGIIASCPACVDNFFNTFCTFTCSPDQSLFVNVTQTEPKGDKFLVTEVDNLWSEEWQSGFYDSCKNVKNGASGGKAIDFIGGGAKNYTQFMKFLGDKKLLGSPFQINYETEPQNPDPHGMEALPIFPKACNDSDPAYRCSCVDCPEVCPTLPEVKSQDYCHVGLMPCMSFAVIIIYSVFLSLVVSISSYVAYRERRYRKPERVRLLQDPVQSDDEDDGELVRGAGYLETPHKRYKLNAIFDKAFNGLGSICARFPAITISLSVLIVGLLSLGWLRFTVETDPVRLWVSPTSDAALDKEFFDDNFGPFFRAEQAFLVNDTGPVLNYDTLSWWFDVESRVRRMISLKQGLTLDDVCFKPTGDACVVQSLTGYYGGSSAGVTPRNWQKTLSHCTESPGDVSCLPDFKQPLQPTMILGGYEDTNNVLDASAIVVTWVVNNFAPGTEGERRAIDWEESLKQVLEVVHEEAHERGLRLSFNTEMSLEQELNKSTNTDAKIVVVSYVIMFIYASIALGSGALTLRSLLTNPSNALVQSKFTLAIVGILIVLMSVSSSIGLFSALGIKVTLIIAEVIPFLVLAVGVDNIFLIVHEFDRVNISHPDEEIDERVGRALGRMGPSILLSAITETVAFAMGIFVGMPAVKNFAAYAAGAVFVNAILQVTMFIAVLALNQRRVESLRADCFPCFTVRRATSSGLPDGAAYDDTAGESFLQRFIRRVYAPALLDRRVKAAIIVIFLGLFTAGLALIPEVELGLDQRIALPTGSYLIQYFDDLAEYFQTGPPVYFVTRGVNITERSHQQQVCGRFSTCEEYSLPFVLEQESKRPSVSYISGSTASWLDDFFYWLNPQQDCCKENGKICFDDRTPAWNITLSGMPEGEEFIHYVEKWIESPTDESCPLGGKAPYSNALVIDSKHLTTNATHFRTSHTPLKTQADFINAQASARRISDYLSKEHNIDIFPYSKFYIFFDQYASIVRLTGTLLGAAIGIIFVVNSVLLGSLATGAVVATTVVMIVVDIIGTMAIAGVSLNAVSLVNLVICAGIGVEFCAHIARAFMFPSRNMLEKSPKFRGKDARVWAALINVGGSVFSGITITKLLGVCVLAFTRSKIFEIYYFRIWLALVIFAATHALIFLPVALSYFGGEGYVDPESDGGLEDNLAARGYRSLLMNDDYDSEEED
ncbi:Short-chain dehydrogenase/reductase SDR [Penicillium occitanis (nom. inval.)]|nr:Short-chain dehydrogenase/reductase SDR [Penicillium occitanis (nom. inval.)]PCG96198.1 hypothetical protein PENOC_073840 [Penicillium occitanis (nom. inval.)]